MTRRQFLVWAGATAAALGAGGSVASAYGFQVVRHDVPVRSLRSPLRIALLADLHYGPYIRPRSVAGWVDATLAHRPDLIVLDGDLVDQHAGDEVDGLVAELARLRAPLGAYAVWGNHDRCHFGDMTAFEAQLRGAGVRVLVNRGVRPRSDLYLAGLDDLLQGHPDLDAALSGRPASAACVLLSHNPDVLPRVPEDVDLTLCGHTHGGQVCLPGVGPLLTSSRYGRRFAHGWVEAPARGYVTRGLGVTLLPVRVACPAELTLLDLVPGVPG